MIAEATIGRAVQDGEHVHHINGVKDDNRPENLEVMLAHEHSKVTNAQKAARIQATQDRLAEAERQVDALRAELMRERGERR